MAGAPAPGTAGIAAPGGIIELPPGIAGTPAPGADGIAAPGGIIDPEPGVAGALELGMAGDKPPGGMLGVLCASNPAGARLTANAAIATVMLFMEPS